MIVGTIAEITEYHDDFRNLHIIAKGRERFGVIEVLSQRYNNFFSRFDNSI